MKGDKKEQGEKKLTAEERAALETMRLEEARGGTQGGGGHNLTEEELGDMGGG